jgi:S1-C subfamily serine protease
MQRVAFRSRAAGSIVVLVAALAGGARAAVVVPGPPLLDLRSVADRVHSFTVAVHARAFVSNGTTGQNAALTEAINSASGILIGDGLVLTTLSAIALQRDGQLAPPATIDVVTDQAGIVPARFVMGDSGLDLALLQLPDQLRELDGATLAPSDPAEGESMIAIGAEGDALYVVGVSLDRVEFGPGKGARLFLNRRLPPSFSGGPLFDADGRLAGISTRAGSDSGFALPASVVRTLLDRIRGATRT